MGQWWWVLKYSETRKDYTKVKLDISTFCFTHPALQVIEDIYLVVYVQLVVLHEAGGLGVGPLDFPHELPKFSTTLSGPFAKVLTGRRVH